jgi:hypothetical protein
MVRAKSPSRRLFDQNRRLRFRLQHMSAEVMQAIQCLAGDAETDQAANQATRHLRCALSGESTVQERATALDNETNEVF